MECSLFVDGNDTQESHPQIPTLRRKLYHAGRSIESLNHDRKQWRLFRGVLPAHQMLHCRVKNDPPAILEGHAFSAT